ncbi:uncharacterized protein C18orf19 homolog A isoform X2 [Cylas formicarius]|uniref:uncharacterized protein C18orf19 homolog A isoform X2 n=1 Tax=Cylas formicarius TaxID=197179 RepID=UPI002958A943|nr:uncharacterized protein C18orf19 homolog A isoform X2 [Cylas formicarius]
MPTRRNIILSSHYVGHRLPWIAVTRKFASERDAKKKVEKKSLFKRFKEMYRDYWYVLIPVHLATSAVWCGAFYYLARSGVDVPALLEAMNFSEKIVNSMRESKMGYVAITYGLYKIATPARYAVTLGGTTVSIQYLKKWGYIKPTKELKEMYQEKKQSMKETKENIMEKVYDFKDKKDNFMESVKETKKGFDDKKDSILSSVKDAKNMVSKVVGTSKSEKS